MKKITHTNGIRIALFATFLLFSGLNLSAQYKLELGWQKDTEWITSITKSDNDSLLYVAFQDLIITVKTSDGTILKSDSVDGSYNLKMSKDGKTLVAAGNYGVGLLDPITFKRIFWSSPDKLSDTPSLMFNEVQNKYVICGSPSLIWIYDVKTKSLDKEIKVKYSELDKTILRNARLTDDGNYIIYSYVTNLQKYKNYIKMMDLEGNIVKEFNEVSSTKFSLTKDSKTLVYFKSATIHFFDLENMKEKEGIPYPYENPEGIEMSNDGKFMLVGLPNGLIYCDFEAKSTSLLWNSGTWRNFKFNQNNSSLFWSLLDVLYKFNILPATSLALDDQNKLELAIQVYFNELIINSRDENIFAKELNFIITSIDGKIVKNILPNEIQTTSNITRINISNLQSGTYLFQILNNREILFTSKFNKIN